MKSLSLVLALLLVPAFVDNNLDGEWTMKLTAPNGMQMDALIRIRTDEALHVEMKGDDGYFPMENVSLVDNMLAFTIPTGHGKIPCTVFYKADTPDRLTGLCTGPAGESTTILTRMESGAEVQSQR